MSAIRCPNCGMLSTDAEIRGGGQFLCRGCGKAIEPRAAGDYIPAPPVQTPGGDDRWSAGPPADSANRWAESSPLGDDSSSSESLSQSAVLPGELDGAPPVRPPWSPLLRALIVLAIFLVVLIALIEVARSLRPWFVAWRQAGADVWLPQLEHGDEQARREAAVAIAALGPGAVCRTLDHISSDPGDGQRFQHAPGAVRALADLGGDAVPGLCEGLRSPSPKVRSVAAEVLEQMGAAGQAACEPLLATLNDPNRWVRYDAIDALGYMGGGPAAAKRLAECVSWPDLFARRHAIVALGRMGPQALAVVETLKTAAADDPDLVTRDAATKALKQVEVARLAGEAHKQASGELRKWLGILEGDDAPAAVAAAESLGKLGFDGQPAAAGLALMLHHPDPQRRLAAAKALAGLGLAAADFTPTLEAAAREEDPEVRAAAAKALERPSGTRPIPAAEEKKE